MEEEIESIQAHNVWTVSEPPRGVRPLTARWVFVTKRDADGNIARFKARLVVRGFMQQEGIDYVDTFAPTATHASLRVFIANALATGLDVHHVDVKTAFLNGDLEEPVWMEQPPGFPLASASLKCRLLKSLYGLKQAPRCWRIKLVEQLSSLGFVECPMEPCLFLRRQQNAPPDLVHVDDILLAALPSRIPALVDALASLFDIRHLGRVSYYLGVHIAYNASAGTATLTQERYNRDVLQRFGFADAKPRSVPLDPGTRLLPAGESPALDIAAASTYREIVGSLMYLAMLTRPDIAHSISALSRYMSAPSSAHMAAAHSILRYLAGTPSLGIRFLASDSMPLCGWGDADHAGESSSSRSTTGFVFKFRGGPTSWSSKLQPTVALSTIEAEYMAAAEVAREAIWLSMLLDHLGHVRDGPVPLWSDNQGALATIKNPLLSSKSNHIRVRHHFVRERQLMKEIAYAFCPTEKMIACSQSLSRKASSLSSAASWAWCE